MFHDLRGAEGLESSYNDVLLPWEPSTPLISVNPTACFQKPCVSTLYVQCCGRISRIRTRLSQYVATVVCFVLVVPASERL